MTVRQTRFAGDGTAIAAANDGNWDAVIAAGGDGTINEVANGLVSGRTPLGIIPLGTANVLAHELDWPKRPKAMAEALMTGTAPEIYPGLANGRRFLLMAGVGLDAWTVAAVKSGLKRRIGPLAYIEALWRVLPKFPFAPYHLTTDGRMVHGVGAVICRAACYGGPFRAAPQQSLARPALTSVVMQKPGTLATIGYGLRLGLGLLHRAKSVAMLDCREAAEIPGPEGEPVQLDGDLLSHLPLAISIDTRPLRLIHAG